MARMQEVGLPPEIAIEPFKTSPISPELQDALDKGMPADLRPVHSSITVNETGRHGCICCSSQHGKMGGAARTFEESFLNSGYVEIPINFLVLTRRE